MARRENVVAWIFVEQVGQADARWRRMRNERKSESNRGNHHAYHQKDGRGDSARARSLSSVSGLRFLSQPVTQEKSKCGQSWREIILLTSRETEKQENHRGPNKEQQQRCFWRTPEFRRFQEPQPHVSQCLRKKRAPRQQPN